MAKADVTQLNSKMDGRAFFNADEEYGYVNVWGTFHERPTYLLLISGNKSGEFHLVQFDDKKIAAEFLEDKKEHYRIIDISRL